MVHQYRNKLVGVSDFELGKRQHGERLKNTGRPSKNQLLV